MPTLPSLLAPAHTAYQTALRRPQHTQVQILHTILRSNQHSQFGQQHNFAQIHNPEDYAQRVPIQSDETLAPLIDRHAHGERNILTSSPIIQFEETGGSTAGAKLIPYTAPLLTAFQHGIHAWFADLIAHRPRAFSGSLYFIISPAARRHSHTAGGIPIGTGNDLNYLGSALAGHIAPQILHHPQLAQAQSPEDWQIRTATLLAQSPSLSLISAWSPTLLLNLIHTLHQQQDRILSQIPDPSLHFIGRSSLTSDLVGEKLTEAFVAQAIRQTLAPVSGCLLLQGTSTPAPHYILWHEPTFTPTAQALAALNTALCTNPQYHYAQQIGQLGNLTARPHPQLLAYASQHAPSRVLGTQKIPMLLPPIT